MTHLLDTTVLSQPIKDVPVERVLDRWSELGDGALCTSAVCLAELIQGLEMRGSAKYWSRYRALLMGRYPVLPFDAGVAATFGRLMAHERSLGRPRPALDLMVAATAVHHGLVIATLNVRHFVGIAGLRVEDWGGAAHGSDGPSAAHAQP